MNSYPLPARWIILTLSLLALIGAVVAMVLGLSSTVITLAAAAGLVGLTLWALPAWIGSLLLLLIASGLWWSGAPLWWILATCGLAALAYLFQGLGVTTAHAARALGKLKLRRWVAAGRGAPGASTPFRLDGPLWRKAVVIVIGAFLALGLAILAARLLAPAANELVSDGSALLTPALSA